MLSVDNPEMYNLFFSPTKPKLVDRFKTDWHCDFFARVNLISDVIFSDFCFIFQKEQLPTKAWFNAVIDLGCQLISTMNL